VYSNGKQAIFSVACFFVPPASAMSQQPAGPFAASQQPAGQFAGPLLHGDSAD
jgi:hypothetical protein